MLCQYIQKQVFYRYLTVLHFIQRLHQVVKRDAELKLQKISQHYENKCQQLNDRSVITHPIQQKRQVVQKEKRVRNIEKVLWRSWRLKYSIVYLTPLFI